MGVTSQTKVASNSTITPKVSLTTQASKPPVKTSLVGDIARGVVNTLTDGHFGNGNAAKQDGETNDQYINRLVQAGGAAAETFNSTVSNPSGSTNVADSFKSGVTTEAVSNGLMTYVPWIIGGVGGFFLIKKLFFNKGASRPKY